MRREEKESSGERKVKGKGEEMRIEKEGEDVEGGRVEVRKEWRKKGEGRSGK